MDSMRLDTGSRLGNAGIAAGVGLATVAAPTLAVSTMLSNGRYGEAFAKTVGRNSLPIVAAFGVPAAVGAFTGSMLGSSGGSSAGMGALGGAVSGAAVGATLMHPIMTSGLGSNAPGRLFTAGLFAAGGALMGAFGGGLAHATIEH